MIGPGRSKDLIFTSRQISADEAKALGLINHIYPEDKFRQHVLEYVRQITANSPSAVSAVKQIINATATMDENAALKFEREKAAENVLTRQCIEGITAFLEKRKPDWKS